VDEATKARSFKIDPADFESGRQILALAPEQQIVLLIQAVDRQASAVSASAAYETFQLKPLIGAILRRKPAFSAAQLEQLVGSVAKVRNGWYDALGTESILRAVERLEPPGALPPSLRGALERLAAVLER